MPFKQGTREYDAYHLRMKLQRRLPLLKPAQMPTLGLIDVVDEYVDRHKKHKATLVVIFRLRDSGEYFKMKKSDAGI